MPHRFRRSIAALNAEADAVCARVDGGWLRIYNGAQPESPDAAVTNQDLLAELAYGAPAFATAEDGAASANAIDADDSAGMSGTASWFRAVSMAGDAVFDGSVGTSEHFDLRLGSTAIEAGARVLVETQIYRAHTGTS